MDVSKILLKRALLIVVIGIATFEGLAFSLALISHFISKSPIQSGSAPPTANTAALAVALNEQEKVSSELPVRLKIPKINVDVAIEYVGLAPDGAMDVPYGPDDVAWFEPGTRPGENGSAVIAGHYGWKNGKAAAFDNLYTLRKGDKLSVEDEKGVTTTFVVRESRRYDPNADASDVFGSNDGKPHLNLITCEGVWNKTEKSYSNRLVVFTDKE